MPRPDGPPETGRVLIVDDDAGFVDVLRRELRHIGFDVATAADGASALRHAESEEVDVILLDLRLGREDGLEILELLRKRSLPAEVIILTGHGTIESAIEAMRRGAREYLTKPCPLDNLEVHIRKAIESCRVREEFAGLKSFLGREDDARPLLTHNPQMREILDSLPRVAESDAPTLIQGESGTGKELVARRVHALSPRQGHSFVALNCAVLRSELLESELFGHEKGAFTGAVRRKLGLFEIASQGTIFLDEVGEIPAGVQAKLLRVLQSGELRRVGGTQEIRVDARVIAATNQDLRRASEEGRFRKDLLYRLDVLTLRLLPLRDRPEDIEPLFLHFLRLYSGGATPTCTPGGLDLLRRYTWPGNVRELENVARRILVLHDHPAVDADVVRAALPGIAETADSATLRLEDVERRHILRVLVQEGNDKRQAARILGISLKTLYNKLHRYGEM